MPGMQPYKPTPKSDPFKAGDTVRFRTDNFGYVTGQLWSRAENPDKLQNPNMPAGYWNPLVKTQGKFWWVVREDQSAYRVSERELIPVSSRDEQLSLTA